MTAPDLAGDLLLATEQLADAVERETECLREARFDQLTPLQDEKRALTVAYEAHLAGFRGRPAGGPLLDSVTREALLQAGERLRHAAALNARAITAARGVTEQLLGAIASAAATEQRPQGYARPMQAPRRSAAALSLSLDQRL